MREFILLLLLALTATACWGQAGLSVQDSAGQNPLLGSAPAGVVSPEPLKLSLLDALDRGLKYNLGAILAEQGTTLAAGQRIRELSKLLPNLEGHLSDAGTQINLKAYGFPVVPGQAYIYGPFNLTDMRAAVTSDVLDFNQLNKYRAARDNERAAQFSYRNTRNLVVLAVGYQYLLTLADASRVESAEAQVATAQALYQQAVDEHQAGVVPNIDVLRAQVELQSQQQRLLVVQNEYAKQLLAVTRVIGLPSGQKIELTDKLPPPAPIAGNLEEDLKTAYENRADFKQAQALLDAAEHERRAAIDERLPSISFAGDFGVIGPSPTQNHETFTAGAMVRVPVFDSGRIRGDVMQAEAQLKRAQAQLEDLRGRIEYEVRTSLLDVDAATKQLTVATSNLELAREQVQQSRDRFKAGVTDNLEVVQAQEARAAAEENYIAALFAHNFAKLELARALGIAEDATRKFLGGK